MSIPATLRIAGPFAWAGGVKPVLTVTAGALDVIEMEWTGSVYLCKVYGLAFAA